MSSARAPDRAVAGEEIAVSWTVTNCGVLAATGAWTDTILVSTGFDRIELGAFVASPLPPGASYSREARVVLPPYRRSRDFAIVVVADARDELLDADELNNARYLDITIELVPTAPPH